MKKIVFTFFLMVAVFGIASAQTVESAKKPQAVEFVFASQGAEQTMTVMDKIQKETEDLILTIAPAPLIKLADVIHHKLEAAKQKKTSKKKSRSKTAEPGCEI